MPRKKINRQIDKRVRVIKHYLIRGDMLRIARITGFHENYVWMVLNGQRYNRRILEEGLRIAKENKKIGLGKRSDGQSVTISRQTAGSGRAAAGSGQAEKSVGRRTAVLTVQKHRL